MVYSMNGVEILVTEEVAVGFIFNSRAASIASVIIFVIFAVIGFITSLSTDDWSDLLISVTIGLVACLLLGMIVGGINRTPTEYETQYKVVVSDEVSMNEFMEKYKIIDQEGKIYTVREKEQVSDQEE